MAGVVPAVTATGLTGAVVLQTLRSRRRVLAWRPTTSAGEECDIPSMNWHNEQASLFRQQLK